MVIRTLISVFFLLTLPFITTSQPQNLTFIYNGFNKTQQNLDPILDGASILKSDGLLKLTNRSANQIGHAFYPQPITIFNRTLSTSSSFATIFVFSITTPPSRNGGYGLAFTLSPSPEFPEAEAGQYLGIFNKTNGGNPSNHVFAVEFDTVNGYNDNEDTIGNHVGININSLESKASEPVAYYRNQTDQKEEFGLDTVNAVQAWIEYDGLSKMVYVTVAPIDQPKPSKPLMTQRIDLAVHLKENMFLGFSASTGLKASAHYILAWSFAINGVAPPITMSALVFPPKETDPASKKDRTLSLVAGLSSAAVLLIGILVIFTLRNLHSRVLKFERLEDWELDCPHRFKYGDLYDATKGFSESKVIGRGGFGKVYKGTLKGSDIAVKRITQNNNMQGIREFAAEIESLGKLSHKNLVNLQGWCKKKKDLLLVYDFVPNGSLDSLLFHPKNNLVLTWEKRFNIIKGIAEALLYLHEGWEKTVIHRDVKSSNVLIGSDLDGRLGDFGLARLYDHDKISHTTSVVGTLGYIAPELARNGKSSTLTDVFAFGNLVLEIVTGKRTINWNGDLLVDWVVPLFQADRTLEIVDGKLGSDYDIEQMERVISLGLLCSYAKPEIRPSMKKVIRCLDGDEPIPAMDLWSSNGSPKVNLDRKSENRTGYGVSRSYNSFSIGGGISNGSLDDGR